MADQKPFLGKNFLSRPLILVLLVFCGYFASLNHSFVWDDYMVVVDTDLIKSWHNLPLVFSREYLTSPSAVHHLDQGGYGAGETSYRPVVTVSYFLDYSLWKLNPFGYHLTSLILHLLNVLLIYMFFNLLLNNPKWSFWAALMFGLHPVQTEAVNNISFREDLLAFLFYLSSLVVFIRSANFSGFKKVTRFFFSNILFLLACFSKEMAVTLPLMVMIYDYYFPPKGEDSFWGRFKSRYLSYWVSLLFYLWVWKFVMPSTNERLIFEGQNAYTNFLTMAKVVGVYLWWLVFPVDIHATVPDWSLAEFSFLSLRVLAALGCIGFLIFLAAHARKSLRAVSFGIAWFFVSLLPVINIIPIQNIMAARYLYLPLAGFCLLFVGSVAYVSQAKSAVFSSDLPNKIIPLLLVGMFMVYSFVTVIKERTWKDNDAFFMELGYYYPLKPWVHRGLGDYLVRQKQFEKAVVEYNIAKRLDPSDTRTRSELGKLYLQVGMLERAVGEFADAVRLDPGLEDVYVNLCTAFADERQFEKSVHCFEKMLSIHPQSVAGYYNLGVLYKVKGDVSRARVMWLKALSIDPRFAPAKNELGALGD